MTIPLPRSRCCGWNAHQHDRPASGLTGTDAPTATSEAAKRLRLSSSRVSQLRRELKEDWAKFQGESLELATASCG